MEPSKVPIDRRSIQDKGQGKGQDEVKARIKERGPRLASQFPVSRLCTQVAANWEQWGCLSQLDRTSGLLGQADAAQKILKARVAAQRVIIWLDLECM